MYVWKSQDGTDWKHSTFLYYFWASLVLNVAFLSQLFQNGSHFISVLRHILKTANFDVYDLHITKMWDVKQNNINVIKITRPVPEQLQFFMSDIVVILMIYIESIHFSPQELQLLRFGLIDPVILNNSNKNHYLWLKISYFLNIHLKFLITSHFQDIKLTQIGIATILKWLKIKMPHML